MHSIASVATNPQFCGRSQRNDVKGPMSAHDGANAAYREEHNFAVDCTDAFDNRTASHAYRPASAIPRYKNPVERSQATAKHARAVSECYGVVLARARGAQRFAQANAWHVTCASQFSDSDAGPEEVTDSTLEWPHVSFLVLLILATIAMIDVISRRLRFAIIGQPAV